MSRRFLLLLPLFALFSLLVQAQNWSGVLNASRTANWTTAGAGAIPARTTICSTLNLTGGTQAASANGKAINAAIASCPAGQVVMLSAGTFYVGSTIVFNNQSNVTLRGAGADQTFLLFTNTATGSWAADVSFQNSDENYTFDPHNTADWTAGYAQGTNQVTLNVTLGSIKNLQPGSLIILDQCDDGLSGEGCTNGSVAGSDTGNIWVCGSDSAKGVCCTGCHTGAGRFDLRHQQQIVEVQSVSGNTVTLEDSLYMPNWRSGQTPGAWWSNGPAISGSGIEDLSMDHSQSSATVGTIFYNAYRCWMKGVRDLSSDRDHVSFYQSAHITVRDSYFYGTKNAQSESYGVEHFQGSSNLVENNIFQHIVSPMLSDDGQGTVFGYNYSVDDYYTPQAGWMMAQDWHHGTGNSYFLWEGNEGQGLIADDIHGTADMLTAFRNRMTGTDTCYSGSSTNTPCSGQTIAVNIYAFTRYTNVIGNVLGTAGYHNTYETNVANFNQSKCATSIYSLGIGGSCWNQSPVPNDNLSKTTAMRWGNYDVVTGSVRWCGSSSDTGWSSTCGGVSEVPSGLNMYANTLPTKGDTGAGQNPLPPSFYLNATPVWWQFANGLTSTPWPAVGPDVSGGNIDNVGGYAYHNPAANCYLNVMSGKTDGGSGILTFNANNCYGSGTSGGTPPSPPTNVTAVAK